MRRDALSHEDQDKVHAALVEIEQNTSADLDVVITRVSDRYPLYPIVWASLGALLATSFLALMRPEFEVRAAMALQLAVLLVLTLVLSWLPIRLALVPELVKRNHARHLAQREFAAQIAANRHLNRILLFVSVGERHVEIIADRATHGLESEDTWAGIIADFVDAMKAGPLVKGVLVAVRRCGVILETHYPVAR